jgi:hypothetical protein
MLNKKHDVYSTLKDCGPITGKILLEKSRKDPLLLWCECKSLKYIRIKTVGSRFLRLDKRVEGYARLSPSILREFLTYSIIGLESDWTSIESEARKLRKKIALISQNKLLLAKKIMTDAVGLKNYKDKLLENSVFLIAGDIVYGMAHEEPRPEPSTGHLVKGSDLDIIIITDGVETEITEDLDSTVYGIKYNLIKMPAFREEVDYVIKDLKKVSLQLMFDNFEFMVASKILVEGKFLLGNPELFKRIKNMLIEKGIPQKLSELESRAIISRNEAEKYLLKAPCHILEEKHRLLFYTKEETEEIF